MGHLPNMHVTRIILLGSQLSLAPLPSTEVFLTLCPDSQDPVYKGHNCPIQLHLTLHPKSIHVPGLQ